MIKWIHLQNLIKRYGAVQELWAFSLKDLDQPKWCSANTHFAYQWLVNVNKMNMQNWIQKYHAVQGLWAFSLTVHNRLKWPSFVKKCCYSCQGLDNVDMHFYANVIKICLRDPELWAFSLTEDGRIDSHSDNNIVCAGAILKYRRHLWTRCLWFVAEHFQACIDLNDQF